MKMNGTDLLADFRETGSEEAFRELMRRYTNLVYSVAKRRLYTAALVEDVAQSVFTRLANSVPKLKTDAELIAWLHRTTVHVAIDMWRSESRRHLREQHAAAMETAPTQDSVWEELSPVLDEALNHLNDKDRQALLLRFFDEKTMREVGGSLGVNEDAAKMRVNRALDRLRTQLIGRGITCSVIGLGAFLTDRSIEAAPSQFGDSLSSMKLSVASSVGLAWIWNLISFLRKGKVVSVVIAAYLIVVGLIIFDYRSPKKTSVVETAQSTASSKTENLQQKRFLTRRTAKPSPPMATQAPENTRLMFHVLDAETGQGLANAKIQAVYFYTGGRPEGHNLVTDESGIAAIPKARERDDVGMNVFVVVEGYVPKAVGLGKSIPTEYVIKLEPSAIVGGTVVDEQGMPVPGVKIDTSRNDSVDPYRQSEPNTDFQTIKVKTDGNGQWRYPFIPKTYESVNFRLFHKDYSVTSVSVPMDKPESMMNTILTIKRGFIIKGRVNDLQGVPIAGAIVRELQNSGFRQLSVKSDTNGEFTLIGLFDAENDVKISVQAKGLSPQTKTVQMLQPTNIANFSLAKGNIFHGRVTDESGHPIFKVVVQTDYDFKNQIYKSYEWRTETDADGRFEWDSAPSEAICYWFEAPGYGIIRGRPLLAEGTEHEIKLRQK